MVPERLCRELRQVLTRAVERNLGDAILLSGGLDSSIIALLASKVGDVKAVSVYLENSPGSDLRYAKMVAGFLGIEHLIRVFNLDELEDAIRSTIRILRTFDPMEVRNSAAIYIALRHAKDNGRRVAMTGDGGDELFAGYSFLYNLDLEELDHKIRKIWKRMSFSSTALGEALGIKVNQPYLDPEMLSFAEKLDSRFRIGFRDEKRYGKFILRMAFEEMLPEEIIWREKVPIEGGSGTSILPRIFDEKISNQDFDKLRERYLMEDGVKIRSKEQLFCYQIYRELFGPPHPDGSTKKICPMCHSNVPDDASYCKVCGAYPI
ncbi:MAG: hypothetical protein DRN65_04120 [Thaumarchaeota archaeon]|nr:MAG: hypothetical protein DRN65_04120 [Nitrososphaerota archaeon]